jgi:hypothetical protein
MTSKERRRHREAVRNGSKMSRLKRKQVINLDAELNDDDFTHAAQRCNYPRLSFSLPSFLFLVLAGEIRCQPSLISACQSVCPCLA